MHRLAAALFLTICAVSTAAAQSTNLSLYQEMAVECLSELPADVDSLILEAPQNMPYVRSALVALWQADGRDVFFPDAPISTARLAYDVEEAAVTYVRRGDRFEREVRLTLRYTVTTESGRVLADDRCSRSRQDLIARAEVDAVQSPVYAETQGQLPRGGWFRRVLEPAVLTAAAAVAVYLFFALRSTGGEDA